VISSEVLLDWINWIDWIDWITLVCSWEWYADTWELDVASKHRIGLLLQGFVEREWKLMKEAVAENPILVKIAAFW
jgi:hypothetical protein